MTALVAACAAGVAALHGLDVDRLRARTAKSDPATRARQEAMWAALRAGASSLAVGRWWRRDHTTVLHARRVVADRIAVDRGLGDCLRAVAERACAAGPEPEPEIHSCPTGFHPEPDVACYRGHHGHGCRCPGCRMRHSSHEARLRAAQRVHERSDGAAVLLRWLADRIDDDALAGVLGVDGGQLRTWREQGSVPAETGRRVRRVAERVGAARRAA